MEIFVPDAAGQSRNVIDVWLSYHGGHRGVYISCPEFQSKVVLPDFLQIDFNLESFSKGRQCP